MASEIPAEYLEQRTKVAKLHEQIAAAKNDEIYASRLASYVTAMIETLHQQLAAELITLNIMHDEISRKIRWPDSISSIQVDNLTGKIVN